MNRLAASIARGLLLLSVTLITQGALADVSDCTDGTRLEHSFSSGAAWSLCARVDERHSLEVSSVYYRAPGGIARSVLEQAHVGQILMHYHDETDARAQIMDDSRSRLLAMNSRTCDGSALMEDRSVMRLCSRVHDNRILAKYAQRPAIQSRRWELFSALQREGLVWTTSISFHEDGQITPSVSLSGRAREWLGTPGFSAALPASRRNLARATVLATWRMVFNLDGSDYDQVQQFDFPLSTTQGNTRPMQVTDLDKEQFATVDRGNFRGWRISDSGGSGYYLDPFNNGFSFVGSKHNWAHYELALTHHKSCERYASDNPVSGDETARCGVSLDDFVDGENLENAHPVLWFSQSRTFNPVNEDWPAISNFRQSFTLLPHDWTPTSPFEVNE